MNIVQNIKSLWNAIFTIDNDAIDAVKELNEILDHMPSLSKEDRKLIGKSLIK